MPDETENLIRRIRTLKFFNLSDAEIAERILKEGVFSIESIFLALKAAEILDS